MRSATSSRPTGPTLSASPTRHLALVGFMGAGKTTLGRAVAERTGRRFVDVDAGVTDDAAAFFRESGEPAFRRREEEVTVRELRVEPAAVLSLGGGAVPSAAVREALRA